VVRFFLQGKPFVVLELPLLFEVNSNLINFIYKIVCVVADEDIQIARLIDRNSLTPDEAKKRIKAQMPLEQKAGMSHYVIENSGSTQDMEEQALGIIKILVDSNHHWRLRSMIVGAFVSIVAGVTWLIWRFQLF
jgi:dephospho-CoA kinase